MDNPTNLTVSKRGASTAHTPGPWRVFNKNGTLAVMAGRGPKNEVVHWSGFDASHLQDQRLANARLIAAAPDMLAALQNVTGILQTDLETHFGAKIAKQIHAAIAKATGTTDTHRDSAPANNERIVP